MQKHINEQQIHINALVDDIAHLKTEHNTVLTDRKNLQSEVMKASDYIVAVQEKCYQSNQ